MTPPRCQAMTAGIRFQFRTCRQPARAWLTLLTILFIMIGAKGNESDDNVVDISYDEQVNTIISIQNACLQFIDSRSNGNNTENNCQPVWDGLLCWPETPPGTTATQQCPDYVLGFTTSENATRRCMSDGTWYVDRDRNTTWTDLSLCRGIRHNDMTISVVESHLGTLGLMYNVGYGISLTSLVLSVIIMIGFKKLHCPRNTIHLNLFFSFILRASISFMKENLLVKGLGFPGDVTRDKNNFLIFKNESTHWECKLFFACFNYILGANYMWIFAEGLYLHMILSVTVFSERGSLKWYILLGWASPLTFMIPWILVRLFKEDVLCWNTHPTPGYFWIMRGPIVLSIVVNFIFFLNIIRVLFTKLNAVNTQEAKKFRKLAKSTLVLIPLFGVHFIVFAWLPNNVNPTAELVQLYFEMFFNSVQGFFVSVLFCFMNGEVQSEFRKKWQRFRITRFNHLPKSRNSSHNATFATYLSRPRESNASVTQLPDSRDNGNGIIRGRNSNLSCKDTTISLLPLKNAHNGHGKNTILEAEEQELINNQTSGYETDNHTRINDYT